MIVRNCLIRIRKGLMLCDAKIKALFVVLLAVPCLLKKILV